MAVATRPPRRDYKAEMRAAIDARHQSPGETGVKASGKPGSGSHSRGAGIGNEQNKLAVTDAGTGSRSGAKGGPSEHPQNLVHATSAGRGTGPGSSGTQGGPSPLAQGPNVPAGGSQAEEAGESVQFEAQEEKGGAEHGEIDNSVAGPRAVGRPGERIPYAGRGNDGRGVGFKAAPGGPVEHPQNVVSPTGAGLGADGKGAGGGGAQKRGGHAQNRVLPVKAKHNSDPGGEQPKKKSLAGAIKRPGALTRAVGGKPSANTDKVRALAAKGTPLQKKQAGYYLNVLAGH